MLQLKEMQHTGGKQTSEQENEDSIAEAPESNHPENKKEWKLSLKIQTIRSLKTVEVKGLCKNVKVPPTLIMLSPRLQLTYCKP